MPTASRTPPGTRSGRSPDRRGPAARRGAPRTQREQSHAVQRRFASCKAAYEAELTVTPAVDAYRVPAGGKFAQPGLVGRLPAAPNILGRGPCVRCAAARVRSGQAREIAKTTALRSIPRAAARPCGLEQV